MFDGNECRTIRPTTDRLQRQPRQSCKYCSCRREDETKTNKQKTNKQQNTSVGENKTFSKPCSVSGEQNAWEKMPGRNRVMATHTHTIISGGGGRARRHPPQKKQQLWRRPSSGPSSIAPPLQQWRRAAAGQCRPPQDHRRLSAATARGHASTVTLPDSQNSNIYFCRRVGR